ncbi:FAD-dependent monooxygenase [Nonomuraea rubra]|uniref:3-(3-hydroxy-phenyl)propionate hydroxylase n=1 Tax=Nonomuraea rubra TaxID=46180 RepID=A0A7X0NZK4_9ACTN|nr:FAD-dependent monooxygenase [Nonomuraea rubra]MBB6552349.1 3-(3-hydroxy-phenyl)propionate hydroxylase [Nonomuraea rubra]
MDTEKISLPVLVVGAGPTGLALATELRRQGITCRIIDRSLDRPAHQARAVAMWPGALDVLARHGTADGVIAAGLRMGAARYWSGSRNVATVRLGDWHNGGPTMLGITQPAVEAVMAARLRELGVAVEWRTELVGLTGHGDHVGVRLDGPGGLEELTAAYVVGCDGAHSTVRELSGIPFAGTTYTQSFILGDGHVSSAVPRGEAHYHLHPDGVLVLVSLPGGGLRVFADAGRAGRLDSAPSAEELQRLATERAPYPVQIKDLTWSTRFPVHMRQAAAYRAGRCLLAGDAAHVHSPAGGQGLNTGIQDAANLGWKLALVLNGHGDADRLLDSYQAERSPVAAQVLRGAHQQTRLWTVRSPIGRLLRDGLLGLLGSTGALERRFIPNLAQDDLDYRKSPVVGPRGGRRAIGARGLPDVTVTPLRGDGAPVRLGELLADPRHTLLVMPGVDPLKVLPGLEPMADRVVARVLVSKGSAYGEPYRVPGGFAGQGPLRGAKLVLVRPDGYVADATTGEDVAALVAPLAGRGRSPRVRA